MVNRLLKGFSKKDLHNAYIEAFSDYQINISLPIERFNSLNKRRGLDQCYSIGAIDNNKIVAFIFNGIREWKSKKTAYDLGTAVIPDYRRKGISTSLFNDITATLKQNNIEQYLLEVLKDNTGAIELYKKKGFKITREFAVYNSNKKDINLSSKIDKNISKVSINDINLQEIMTFWDFKPSWQNSLDSIIAAPELFTIIAYHIKGELVGYGIVENVSGDVPQIAVKKSYRRRGIGSSIMSSLMDITTKDKITIINIEESCSSMINFLEKCNFSIMTRQYEMIKEIL